MEAGATPSLSKASPIRGDLLFLWMILTCVLCVPMVLVARLPFQDLPNHLATASILHDLPAYPEFKFNGWFTTNRLLFAWLYLLGPRMGIVWASKVLLALVIGLGSFAYLRFVRAYVPKVDLRFAAACLPPVVHNFFVSMGMLEFAFSVALVTLMLSKMVEAGPRWPLLLLSLVAWYAHVFPLLVLGLLVLIDMALRRARNARQDLPLLLALLPGGLLSAWSLVAHWLEPKRETIPNYFPPLWDAFYNLWADWFFGFTKWSLFSFALALYLALRLLRHRQAERAYFSNWAVGVLFALYLAAPSIVSNWFHVNSRFIPFLCLAALARLPETVPRSLYRVMVAGSATYCASLAVDYVRIDREVSEVTAGIDVVPERARLLPLVFDRKGISENTRPLLHAWGYYVVEKKTTAPLLFAHSASFPLMYKEVPSPRFTGIHLGTFSRSLATSSGVCEDLLAHGVVEDCQETFRHHWRTYWEAMEPKYDWVTTWGASQEVRELIPKVFRPVFTKGRLTVWKKESATL